MNTDSVPFVSHMKTNRRFLVMLFALTAPFVAAQSTVPVTLPAAATKPITKGHHKPYPLKVCLVTDSDLDSMGDEVTFVYQGQTIKFCCKPCEKKFLKNPEKYLAKLAAQESASGK